MEDNYSIGYSEGYDKGWEDGCEVGKDIANDLFQSRLAEVERERDAEMIAFADYVGVRGLTYDQGNWYEMNGEMVYLDIILTQFKQQQSENNGKGTEQT